MFFEKISKFEGFLECQVYGWIYCYEKLKISDILEVEVLKKWLIIYILIIQYLIIIYYDYKFNNMLFLLDGNKIVGLFDWEMIIVGDLFVDLGVVLSYWMEDSDFEFLKRGFGNLFVIV